ncbi:MAG: YceI family protein [Pseudomonadota bacterium]
MPRLLWLVFALALTTPANAGPEPYRLDRERSEVRFSFTLQGATVTGLMPVKTAEMSIDLDNVQASAVDVTLDARNARAGVFFVTQTMTGPQVLATDTFPEIRFRSTGFAGDLSGATVTGDLTIRDVTRPVTLQADLFRQRGTELGDRSQLSVLLTGTISRSAFGASGFPGFVDDPITLRILARIEK